MDLKPQCFAKTVQLVEKGVSIPNPYMVDIGEEVNPDLVVMDILKTENHELDICRNIRQWSAAPVLMVSTWQTGEGEIRKPDGICPAETKSSINIRELLGQIEAMINGESFSHN